MHAASSSDANFPPLSQAAVSITSCVSIGDFLSKSYISKHLTKYNWAVQVFSLNGVKCTSRSSQTDHVAVHVVTRKIKCNHLSLEQKNFFFFLAILEFFFYLMFFFLFFLANLMHNQNATSVW